MDDQIKRVLCSLESLSNDLVLTFKALNNKVEYEALMTDLRLAKGIGIASLIVYCDYQLVINHFQGEYIAKGGKMKMYLK